MILFEKLTHTGNPFIILGTVCLYSSLPVCCSHFNPAILCHPEDDGFPFKVPFKVSSSWCLTELFLATVFSDLPIIDLNLHTYICNAA